MRVCADQMRTTAVLGAMPTGQRASMATTTTTTATKTTGKKTGG